MVHFVRLVKHGNSLYLSIPPALRRGLHWNRGDQVALVVDGERLVATKMDARKSADVVLELSRGRAREKPAGE